MFMKNFKNKILGAALSVGIVLTSMGPAFASENIEMDSASNSVTEEFNSAEMTPNSQIKNYNYLIKPNFSTRFFKNQNQIKDYVTDYLYLIQDYDRFSAMPKTDVSDVALRLQDDRNLNEKINRFNIADVLFEIDDLTSYYIDDYEEVDNFTLNVSYRYSPVTDELTKVFIRKGSREEVNKRRQSTPGSKSIILPTKAQYNASSRKADEIVRSIPSNIRGNDALVAKYLTDWITRNNVYDDDNRYDVHNNYYGALIKGVSKCDGFSQALDMLLRRAGIPAYRLIGNFKGIDNSVSHAWNMIYIQGKWVMVDATFNVGSSSFPERAFAGTYGNDFYKDYRAASPYINTMSQVVGYTPYNYKKHLAFTSTNTTEERERRTEADKSVLKAKYDDISKALKDGQNFKFNEKDVRKYLDDAKKVLDEKYASQRSVDEQIAKLDIYGEYSVVSRKALYDKIMGVKWALYKRYTFEYHSSLVVSFLNDAIRTYNNPNATGNEIKDAISSIDLFCAYKEPAKVVVPKEKTALKTKINEVKSALYNGYQFEYTRSVVVGVTNKAIRTYNNSNSKKSDYERELRALELFCKYSTKKNDKHVNEEIDNKQINQDADNVKADDSIEDKKTIINNDTKDADDSKEDINNKTNTENINDDKINTTEGSENEKKNLVDESESKNDSDEKDLLKYKNSIVSLDEINDMTYNVYKEGKHEDDEIFKFVESLNTKEDVKQSELDLAFIKLSILSKEDNNKKDSEIKSNDILSKINELKTKIENEDNEEFKFVYDKIYISEVLDVLKSETANKDSDLTLKEINEYIELLSREK